MHTVPCVYCGSRPGTTHDHVPPKAIFDEPRPPTLITVPCCESCRISQSLDDEYFRDRLALRHDVAAHPVAQRALAATMRSLVRPQKARYTLRFLQGMKRIPLRTPAGLHAGAAGSYDVELSRLNAVIRRVTIGLLFHEYGVRLPEGHECDARSLEGYDLTDPASATAVGELLKAALAGNRRSFDEHRTFVYWHQQFGHDPASTLWAFVVYGRVAFTAITAERTQLAREAS